jgi:hypothetical protein
MSSAAMDERYALGKAAGRDEMRAEYSKIPALTQIERDLVGTIVTKLAAQALLHDPDAGDLARTIIGVPRDAFQFSQRRVEDDVQDHVIYSTRVKIDFVQHQAVEGYDVRRGR